MRRANFYAESNLTSILVQYTTIRMSSTSPNAGDVPTKGSPS